VLLDALGKALIRQIQERNQLALFEYRDELLPLGTAEIHPCWVVATRMQQNNTARRQLHEITEHTLKIHSLGRRIEITINMRAHATTFKNGIVVGPVRIADPQLAIGISLVQQLTTNTQCTRTADTLDGSNTPLVNGRLPKQERLY